VVETRQIDGRTVTFRHEEGRRPSLICLHGAADNHHAYDHLLDALSSCDRYAINLPDRAGTVGPPLTSVAEMEAFLSGFLESEVDGDYVVAGHSLGGGIAIEHALASRSERLKGIVLLATGARLRVHPMILQLFEQAAKFGGLPPLPPGLYETGADPDLIARASKHRELTPIPTGGTDWRAADAFDRMQDVKDIQVPALIIAGTHDALTPPKYAEYLAANIAENELHVIERAGHMLVMERVPEVSRVIEGFMSRLWGHAALS
jgi:pimeloyl-ACP methyl ester carboxylesterase